MRSTHSNAFLWRRQEQARKQFLKYFHERFLGMLSEWQPEIAVAFPQNESANLNRILIKFEPPNQIA